MSLFVMRRSCIVSRHASRTSIRVRRGSRTLVNVFRKVCVPVTRHVPSICATQKGQAGETACETWQVDVGVVLTVMTTIPGLNSTDNVRRGYGG